MRRIRCFGVVAAILLASPPAKPGHELHVSPYIGAVMDGASLAVRLNFYD